MTSSVAVEPKMTAFERVGLELRNRIISGALAGGTRLHVDALRHEFGVSTSTVREALSRLLAWSLVESQPNIGFTVAPLNRADCVAVARTRELLEIEALRDSLTHRSDAWEAALAGAYHLLARADRSFITEGNPAAEQEWRTRNQAFHEAMVSACGNRYLLNFRQSCNYNSERYRALLPHVSRSATQVPEEHRALFETATEGRIDDCLEIMRRHISTSVGLVIDLLPEG